MISSSSSSGTKTTLSNKESSKRSTSTSYSKNENHRDRLQSLISMVPPPPLVLSSHSSWSPLSSSLSSSIVREGRQQPRAAGSAVVVGMGVQGGGIDRPYDYFHQQQDAASIFRRDNNNSSNNNNNKSYNSGSFDSFSTSSSTTESSASSAAVSAIAATATASMDRSSFVVLLMIVFAVCGLLFSTYYQFDKMVRYSLYVAAQAEAAAEAHLLTIGFVQQESNAHAAMNVIDPNHQNEGGVGAYSAAGTASSGTDEVVAAPPSVDVDVDVDVEVEDIHYADFQQVRLYPDDNDDELGDDDQVNQDIGEYHPPQRHRHQPLQGRHVRHR